MPVNYPGKLVVIEGTDGVGRSTQTELLKHWLEIEGHGVAISEWKSSKLISQAIDKAKSKNALNTITFSLLYATDLADRLNSVIIPALKAGFVVIADRYFFTALARDVVRGADPAWVRKLYGFAPQPDLVFYLRMPIDDLIKRIITSRGSLDFHESGRDMGMSTDLYQSFKLYQSKIVHEYERMSDEYGFKVIDASAHPEHVQKILRANIRKQLFEEVPQKPQFSAFPIRIAEIGAQASNDTGIPGPKPSFPPGTSAQ